MQIFSARAFQKSAHLGCLVCTLCFVVVHGHYEGFFSPEGLVKTGFYVLTHHEHMSINIFLPIA